MHTMWAALLANAASIQCHAIVRPGFLATSRQSAPDEAALLKWMHERTWKPEGTMTVPVAELFRVYSDLGFLQDVSATPFVDVREALTDTFRFGTCVDSLEAAQLVPTERGYEERVYKLTTRGDQFVIPCRAPKPES